MRRTKILAAVGLILATALVTTGVLIAGFGLWLHRAWEDSTIVVREAPFQVIIPGEPAASGRLYRLGHGDDYLLVLTSKAAEYPEGYLMKVGTREIGLPDFPQYVRIFKYALIDSSVYDGFPFLGELDAEWIRANGGRELRLRIRGFSDVAQKAEPKTPDDVREALPIAYQREIIIRFR